MSCQIPVGDHCGSCGGKLLWSHLLLPPGWIPFLTRANPGWDPPRAEARKFHHQPWAGNHLSSWSRLLLFLWQSRWQCIVRRRCQIILVHIQYLASAKNVRGSSLVIDNNIINSLSRAMQALSWSMRESFWQWLAKLRRWKQQKCKGELRLKGNFGRSGEKF